MASFRIVWAALAAFLVIASCHATDRIFQLPQTVRRRTLYQIPCSADSQCTKVGCSCAAGVCSHAFILTTLLGDCPRCTSNAQCQYQNGCTTSGRCLLCTAIALDVAADSCVPKKTNRVPHSSASPSPAVATPSAATPSAATPTTVTPDATNSPVQTLAAENSPGTNTTSDNTAAKPCIATSWLRERGIEHAAIRHSGVANVICIPGSALPCGTPGHILLECTGERGGCKLVTYREVCEQRGDCINSAMPVSQLSHTIDWSRFYAIGTAETARLELTSLSAHPLSNPSSPSRLIAYAAHQLNSAGLGSICNAVALFPHLLPRLRWEQNLS